MRFTATALGLILLGSLGSAPVHAQSTAPGDIEEVKRMWNPQAMMQQACDGISNHYKLDAEQRDVTCKMITDRVTNFLTENNEIWSVLMDLGQYQLRGEQPDSDAAKRLAERAYPIFLKAREEILRAQDDWGKILKTDEQRRIHAEDRRGLEMQLRSYDRLLGDWRSGRVGKRSPLNIRLAGGQQLVPKVADPDEATLIERNETEWEKYVKEFVQDYQLIESQKMTAMAILKDLQDQAVQYRKTYQKELREADILVTGAKRARPFDPEALNRAVELQKLINRPFVDWFNELKQRLDQIPTEKQKEQYRLQHSNATTPSVVRESPPPSSHPNVAPAPKEQTQRDEG